jgi:3-oxoacyl-[acyl-carrier protein] reductase
MGLLDGKAALVTGAGNGIGRAIALAMAAEGASVVANDLGGDWAGDGKDPRAASQTADEITAGGGSAVANHGDVTDAEAAGAMVTQAVQSFGRLDIVVNAAGFLRDAMIFSMTDEQWDAVVRVHLTGHFQIAHAACVRWRAQAKETGEPVNGRLITFSSEAGIYGNAAQANYASAKGGIISLSWVVAREMEKYGVTCNVIAPRARTRMTVNTFGGDFAPHEGDGVDVWDPANVAPTAVFLASDEGGAYTGQVLVAGGGTVQVIEPFSVAEQIRIEDRDPEPADIGELLARVRGAEGGPPAFPKLLPET